MEAVAVDLRRVTLLAKDARQKMSSCVVGLQESGYAFAESFRQAEGRRATLAQIEAIRKKARDLALLCFS